MSSYLIFETTGIILSIVAMVKTKKFEKINEEDKGPYKIIDSEYQSFLAFNIVGLICLMIGFIFFISETSKEKFLILIYLIFVIAVIAKKQTQKMKIKL